MTQNDKIQLFEDKRIRTAWDEEKEEWYFSIVDVCEVLSGTDNPHRYWSNLKRKLKAEGSVELYEKIVQLKMTAQVLENRHCHPMTRRSKLCIACSDLFYKSERTHAAAPPFQTANASLVCGLIKRGIENENIRMEAT